MPITLEKLFSLTNTVTVEHLGDTAEVVWSPARWTGEMQDFAESTRAELTTSQEEITTLLEGAQVLDDRAAILEDADGDATALRSEAETARAKAKDLNAALSHRSLDGIRESLSRLLVSWDVLDGTKPIATDVPTLKRLPDHFLVKVWLALFEENQPDPTNAPDSSELSSTDPMTSAPSPTGTSSSPAPARSGSRRSSSTSGRTPHAVTRPGGPGR